MMLALQILILIPCVIFLAAVIWAGWFAYSNDNRYGLKQSRNATWVVILWPICATYAGWFFVSYLIAVLSHG